MPYIQYDLSYTWCCLFVPETVWDKCLKTWLCDEIFLSSSSHQWWMSLVSVLLHSAISELWHLEKFSIHLWLILCSVSLPIQMRLHTLCITAVVAAEHIKPASVNTAAKLWWLDVKMCCFSFLHSIRKTIRMHLGKQIFSFSPQPVWLCSDCYLIIMWNELHVPPLCKDCF